MIMKVKPKTIDAEATLISNLNQIDMKFVKPGNGNAFMFDTKGYLYELTFIGLSTDDIEDQSNSITKEDLEELRNA